MRIENMNTKNIYFGLLLTVISLIMVSCREKHACEGYWEGGGNSQTQKFYCLSIKDDGSFNLTIIPERPEGYVQLYIGPQTNYYGTWEAISDNEIELTSRRRDEKYSSGSNEYMESETFYLRQDGALCKNNKNFLYPDVDLIKQVKN